VLGALRAHLPLHPSPQSRLEGELLLEAEVPRLGEGELLQEGFVPRGYLAPSPAPDDEEPLSSSVESAEALAPPDEHAGLEPESGDRSTWGRRRPARRYRVFDSGVFPQFRRQTAKR